MKNKINGKGFSLATTTHWQALAWRSGFKLIAKIFLNKRLHNMCVMSTLRQWQLRAWVITPKEGYNDKQMPIVVAATRKEAAQYTADCLVIDIVEKGHGFLVKTEYDEGDFITRVFEYKTRKRDDNNLLCVYWI